MTTTATFLLKKLPRISSGQTLQMFGFVETTTNGELCVRLAFRKSTLLEMQRILKNSVHLQKQCQSFYEIRYATGAIWNCHEYLAFMTFLMHHLLNAFGKKQMVS